MTDENEELNLDEEEYDDGDDYGNDPQGERFGDEYDTGPNYVASITDFERVGLGLAHAGEESTKNPLDRFKDRIGAIGQELELSIEEIDIIKEEADDDLFPYKYINPGAFVLGFIATNGGRGMTVQSMQYAFGLIHDIRDTGIEQPDVVRYARYWCKVLRNC